MINYKKITACCLSMLSLLSCQSATVIYSGQFKGQEYTLTSIESKGPSTNSFTEKLKLGRLPAVIIDTSTTDFDVPYSSDVYAGATYIPLPVSQTPYNNQWDRTKGRSSVLYISDKKYSKSEFDQYKDLMISEWPKIDKKFFSDDRSFTHIIGLVHGDNENFVQTFKAQYQGEPFLITVAPDGIINFFKDDDKRNYQYSGLSERIQMPGKIILLKTDKDKLLTKNELLMFKDDQDKTLADYFTIKEN